ncbi:MAG: hypothetical protein GY711_02025 [bacterium]|nr:hypothetical protein [bacterium]
MWALALDSGEPRRVTQAAEHSLYLEPSLGPDGHSVLFARRAERTRDDTNIALVDLRPPTESKSSDDLVFGPAWRWMEGCATPTRTIEMVSAQFFPAWGPQGERIAYTHVHSRWAGRVVAEIWEARVDHSEARQLTLLDSLSVEPAWSPDGREIAFSSKKGGQFDLYAVDVATRELQPLVEHPAADTDPVYSPDGGEIAFVSTRSGESSIWILTRKTGKARELRPFGDPRRCASPDWR